MQFVNLNDFRKRNGYAQIIHLKLNTINR